MSASKGDENTNPDEERKLAAIPDGAVITEETYTNYVMIPRKKKDFHSGEDFLIVRPSKIQSTSIAVAAESKTPQNISSN